MSGTKMSGTKRSRSWRKIGALILAIAVSAVAAIALFMRSWIPFGGSIEGDRLARIQRSPNWRNGKFRNLVPTSMLSNGGLWRSLYQQFSGREKRNPDRPIPIERLSASALGAPQSLRAVWIGHSSVLVDIDGMRILTDPVWSERCSPFQSIGPKRFHPPPIALDDVGKIDAVVISHDHYDHLDMQTIQSLSPRGTMFFVPLGIGAHLERWGVPKGQIRELDWHEEARLLGLRFVSLPARHYSGRRIADRDETEWASWAVIGPSHRLFFSGDSGTFDEFREIGATYGPFDLTLIKIGAYGDTWPDIQMTPEEAVETDLAVRGKFMIPVHWGTFNLAYHDWYEPADRFEKAATGRIAFAIPRPGAIVDPKRPPAIEPWWR
jgi:L-ascorbate metabolism protein UlaG (beta-lactamase superfamily)